MRLKLIRTGGYSKEPTKTVDIDTSKLSSWMREDIESLVRDSNFFDLPSSMPKTDWKSDIFEYMITVIDDKDRFHSVETSESNAPKELIKLIRRIEQV
jgi:hypothetical protein